MKKFNKHINKVDSYLEENEDRKMEKEKELLVEAVNDYFETYPKFNKENLEEVQNGILERINLLHEETEDYSQDELKVWFYTIIKSLRTVNNISYRDPCDKPQNVIDQYNKFIDSKFARENYQGRKYIED